MKVTLKKYESIDVPSGVFQVFVVSGRVVVEIDGKPVEYIYPGRVSKVYVSDGENVSIRNILAVNAEIVLLQ